MTKSGAYRHVNDLLVALVKVQIKTISQTCCLPIIPIDSFAEIRNVVFPPSSSLLCEVEVIGDGLERIPRRNSSQLTFTSTTTTLLF